MTVLLDASALLALLNQEAGADVVEEHMSDAVVLAVNLEEVIGTLMRNGMSPALVERALLPLAVPVVPFTEEMAWRSGERRAQLPEALGMADRCCLAAAAANHLPVLTADTRWTAAATAFKVQVTQIR